MNWLNPLTYLAAEALLNSLWSGILLSGVACGLLRIFKRTGAKTRFAIWWLTLLAVIGLPLLFGFSARDRTPHTNPTVAYNLAMPKKSIYVTKTAMDRDDTPRAAQEKIRSSFETDLTSQSERISLTHRLESIDLRFSIALPSSYWLLLPFFGWLVVTSVMFNRVIRSYRHIRKLSHNASRLPQKYQDRLIHAKETIGLKRAVRLCDSSEISQPMAIGLTHPSILIPKSLIHQLTFAEFDLVLLHELAHIKRWDNWTLLFQKLAEALFFFNPTVWWIGAKLNAAREIACDDLTVVKAGESLRYAACLTKLVELNICKQYPSLTTGVMRSKKQIVRRIEMLLDKKRQTTAGFSFLRFSVTLGILLIAFVLCGQMGIVARTEPNQVHAEDLVTSEQQKLVAELAKQMKNESEKVRGSVVGVLEEIGVVAVPVLIDALNDESVTVRYYAIEALRGIGEDLTNADPVTTDIFIALKRAWKDESVKVRKNAAETIDALIDMKTTSPTAIPKLVTLLNGSSERMSLEAIDSLGDMGPPASSAVPVLIETMTSDSEHIRRETARALGRIGVLNQAVSTALVQALGDESWMVRREAAKALKRLANRE